MEGTFVRTVFQLLDWILGKKTPVTSEKFPQFGKSH